jgi:hypothetical protein
MKHSRARTVRSATPLRQRTAARPSYPHRDADGLRGLYTLAAAAEMLSCLDRDSAGYGRRTGRTSTTWSPSPAPPAIMRRVGHPSGRPSRQFD